MDKKAYRPRLIDAQIQDLLGIFGALCIEGPKWCGKTWTSLYHANSSVFIGDPAGNFQNRRLAQVDPSLVLNGEHPRLIDEWQEFPPLWDAVRFQVDQGQGKGQFILTGSATPQHKGILHSGAGRIARLQMRPMSLFESGDSSGVVSLQNIFEKKLAPVATGEIRLEFLIDCILRGGWPESVGMDVAKASKVPLLYLQAIIEDDAHRLDGIKRDSLKLSMLLRSLARNESTTASIKKLCSDIQTVDNETIDDRTVSSYLDILSRLFLIDNQRPFSTNVRSASRIKQAEKRHLVDPSLSAALLGVTKDSLVHDLQTLGFLFEALCERDLRIYAHASSWKLYHYQDYENFEIDAVIERADGSWGAFEIKLGAHEIDAAAENLLKLDAKIASDPRGKRPVVLCVICGMSHAAYIREDGVVVVPITALRN